MSHLTSCVINLIFKYCMQARRQEGFEGVHSNPLFGLQKVLYTVLTVPYGWKVVR